MWMPEFLRPGVWLSIHDFLFTFYAITPLLIFALHSVWTLFLSHPSCILIAPDHSWLIPLLNCSILSFPITIHFDFCFLSALFLCFYTSMTSPLTPLQICNAHYPACLSFSCPPAWLLSFLYARVCMSRWWLQLDPSNVRSWHAKHDLTGFSCCVLISCMYVRTSVLVSTWRRATATCSSVRAAVMFLRVDQWLWPY